MMQGKEQCLHVVVVALFSGNVPSDTFLPDYKSSLRTCDLTYGIII